MGTKFEDWAEAADTPQQEKLREIFEELTRVMLDTPSDPP